MKRNLALIAGAALGFALSVLFVSTPSEAKITPPVINCNPNTQSCTFQATTIGGTLTTTTGTFTSNVANASNARGFTFNAANITSNTDRYSIVVQLAGVDSVFLRSNGQLLLPSAVNATQFVLPSGNVIFDTSGITASGGSTRVDLSQNQAAQDIMIVSARTMSAGNTAVRLGSSIAAGSVDKDAKLVPIGVGLTATTGSGTLKTVVLGSGKLSWQDSEFTDDSATTGSRTVNKVTGINSFAGAATAITITNDRVTANSNVVATLITNDATAIIKNVVPAAGSFVITLSAAATGTTKVRWTVFE